MFPQRFPSIRTSACHHNNIVGKIVQAFFTKFFASINFFLILFIGSFLIRNHFPLVFTHSLPFTLPGRPLILVQRARNT